MEKNILDFQKMKKSSEKDDGLASYDYPTAMFAEKDILGKGS